MSDWRAHTQYEGGFSAASPAVLWFWAGVARMSQHQRARLLQYVTGSSAVPAQGFGALVGGGGQLRLFTLQRVDPAAFPYPHAHTCFNR